MPYFSSFIAKSRLNSLDDTGQGQRSLCVTHSLMLVIICALYGKNPSRTVGVTEQTQNAGWTDGMEPKYPPPPPPHTHTHTHTLAPNQLHYKKELEWAASNGNRYPPYPQVMAINSHVPIMTTSSCQILCHLFQVICQQMHSHLKMP